MNFLAHCSLAHDAATAWHCDEEQRLGLLAGAVIGDFVKGRIPQDWPIALQAGTRLHRKIDALSNQSEGIRQTCQRYPAELRRLAPIFVDLLADHHLSNLWHDHYAQPRSEFARECYGAINTHRAYLSQDGQRFLDYMEDVDLLAHYHEWTHIRRGLHSVLRRLKQPELFEDVATMSARVAQHSINDFHRYFPELQQAWRSWNAFEAIAAQQSS